MPYIESNQRDDYDPIRVQLKHGDGTIVDLTGVISTDIRWIIEDLTDNSLNILNTGTIEDAVAGRIQLALTTALVAGAGTFEIEIEVTFAGAEIKTFPTKEKFTWKILPDKA